jgi:hypothetical protein
MDVQLVFINESDAGMQTNVVLFQRNNAVDAPNERPIAWRVLPVAGRGAQQKMHVSKRLSVAAKDPLGSVCEQHLTEYEQHWDVITTRNRDWMILNNDVTEPDRIAIRNNLSRASITAQVYKDGRLLAEQPKVESRQTAVFHFDNTIWMGLTSEPIREGDSIPSVNSLRFVTELPLEGFCKADLVLSNTGDTYKFCLLPVAQEQERVLAYK